MGLHLRRGTPFEAEYSASSAVHSGPRTFVSGLVSPDSDVASQAQRVFDDIASALVACGAFPADVVRTRIFYTNAGDLPTIGAAHRAAFGAVRPAATFVQVTRLPFGARVTVEAEALRALTGTRRPDAAGAPNAAEYGYSGVVQVGDEVWLAGAMVRRDNGTLVAPGDALAQAAYIARVVTERLDSCGATPGDIVSTRHYTAKAYHDASTFEGRRPVMAPGDPTSAGITVEGVGHPELALALDLEAVVGAASRRRNLRTGRTYEVEHSYSRSVRVGDVVYVSGSTSVNLKEAVDWPYDAYHQALQTLGLICHTVAQQGLPFRDIVRTRSYVVGEENLAAVARALREIFGGVCPAATVVGVPVLGRPEIMVEIEATAVAGHGN